jgi:hypothetical protein
MRKKKLNQSFIQLSALGSLFLGASSTSWVAMIFQNPLFRKRIPMDGLNNTINDLVTQKLDDH